MELPFRDIDSVKNLYGRYSAMYVKHQCARRFEIALFE